MKSKLYFMELGHVLEHAGFTIVNMGPSYKQISLFSFVSQPR